MLQIQVLEDLLNVGLSKRTLSHYHRQRRLIGAANEEDFGSAILLECLEARRARTQMTDEDVFRAIDRVGHRIRRELRRRPIELPPGTADIRHHPDAIVDVVALREAISSLSPLDLLIVENHFINGEPVAVLSPRLGIARRTLYRRIAEIRRELKNAVD